MDYSKSKFIFRSTLLLLATYIILIEPITLIRIPKSIYYISWFLLMIEIIITMIPKYSHHTSYGKHFLKHFKEVENYKKELLYRIKEATNKRTIFTFILWILLLVVIGVLTYFKVLQKQHIYFISILFYFFDHFCINVFCPFQKYLIKTKCCNSCRIYNWGHFMTFSPLIFVPNFFTYSLVLASLLVLIQWEILHERYPERFYEISNANLQCTNCGITCRYNKKKKN